MTADRPAYRDEVRLPSGETYRSIIYRDDFGWNARCIERDIDLPGETPDVARLRLDSQYRILMVIYGEKFEKIRPSSEMHAKRWHALEWFV